MKKIFICSPYRGDVESNTRLAKKIGRIAALCEYVPVIPHLMYTSFLDDANPEDRISGLTMSVELLASCDMMWIIGNKISKGMAFEITRAKELGIPVRIYDTDCNRIAANTLEIDDRVSSDLVEILRGAKLD